MKTNMEHLKEYLGGKVKGDHDLFGNKVHDGDEIRIKTLANFEGYECRIWAPEYHSLLLDTAIDHAEAGEKLRKSLEFIKGPIDGKYELSEEGSNTANSFAVIQNAVLSTYCCISSSESWINKTIYECVENELSFVRNTKERNPVTWGAKRIEKDCGLAEKLFVVFPALYGKEGIKPHVTTRSRFEELISDRNTVMHIKNSPKISGSSQKRIDLSLKLLRRNLIFVPKNTIAMIKMLHDHCGIELPLWLIGNIGKCEKSEKAIKSI